MSNLLFPILVLFLLLFYQVWVSSNYFPCRTIPSRTLRPTWSSVYCILFWSRDQERGKSSGSGITWMFSFLKLSLWVVIKMSKIVLWLYADYILRRKRKWWKTFDVSPSRNMDGFEFRTFDFRHKLTRDP